MKNDFKGHKNLKQIFNNDNNDYNGNDNRNFLVILFFFLFLFQNVYGVPPVKTNPSSGSGSGSSNEKNILKTDKCVLQNDKFSFVIIDIKDKKTYLKISAFNQDTNKTHKIISFENNIIIDYKTHFICYDYDLNKFFECNINRNEFNFYWTKN